MTQDLLSQTNRVVFSEVTSPSKRIIRAFRVHTTNNKHQCYTLRIDPEELRSKKQTVEQYIAEFILRQEGNIINWFYVGSEVPQFKLENPAQICNGHLLEEKKQIDKKEEQQDENMTVAFGQILGKRRRKAIVYTDYGSDEEDSGSANQLLQTKKRRLEIQLNEELLSMREPTKLYATTVTPEPPTDFYASEESITAEKRSKQESNQFHFDSSELIKPKYMSVIWTNYLDNIVQKPEQKYQTKIESVQRFIDGITSITKETTVPPKTVFSAMAKLLLECGQLPLIPSDQKFLDSVKGRCVSARAQQRDVPYNQKIEKIAAKWLVLFEAFYWKDKFCFKTSDIWHPDAHDLFYSMTTFYTHASSTEYLRIAAQHLIYDFERKMEMKADQGKSCLYSTKNEKKWRFKQTLFWAMLKTVKNKAGYIESLVSVLIDLLAETFYKGSEIYFSRVFGQLLNMIMTIVDVTMHDAYTKSVELILSKTRYRFPDLALAAMTCQSRWFLEFCFVKHIDVYVSKFTHKGAKPKDDIETFLMFTQMEPLEFDSNEHEDLLEEQNPFMDRLRFLAIVVNALANYWFPLSSFSSEHARFDELSTGVQQFAKRMKRAIVDQSKSEEVKQFIIRQVTCLEQRFSRE